MLIVKSKYKIAKRLGAGVFDKTQTQKFALSEAKSKGNKSSGGRRGGSDYGKQLLEKQKVRFTYGLSEKQLSLYVEKAMQATNPSSELFKLLETRADNVLYRAGLSKTRRSSRQAVSHGHFLINGKKTTTPSQILKEGDVIRVREGVQKSPLYAGLADIAPEDKRSIPSWLDVDISTQSAKVTGSPRYAASEVGLDFATVFEFYSR